MNYTILMSNLGYMRGINGCLSHHLFFAHRHLYCSPAAQKKTLHQVAALIEREDPDLCCFVEIDKGSLDSVGFNQIEALVSDRYPYFDIENKYGLTSRLRSLPLTRGKSNGFLSKHEFPHEKMYFDAGTKRLIYKIRLGNDLTLFFAHYSLKQKVREQQLRQTQRLIEATPGEIIWMGDFNIHTGFRELAPLLDQGNLVVLNREEHPTFRFHKTHMVLDLAICSHAIAGKIDLQIVPQPYSDHSALLLKIKS